MGIALIPLALIIIIISTPIILAVYFKVYKRNINRALTTSGEKHLHMIPPYKVVSVLFVVFTICVVSLVITIFPYFNRTTTAQEIEEQLRQNNTVQSDWDIEIAMDSNIAAALAYDPNLTDYSFAIYRNAHNRFPDYEFRYGGSTASVEHGVRIFEYARSLALVSMNELHIAKIECHDGAVFEIDPTRPFVIILPSGGFDVYDNSGNLINIKEHSHYELTKIEIAN